MSDQDIVFSDDGAVAETRGGIVLPTGRRRVSAQDVIEQLRDVLSTDYDGTDDKKIGLTKGEAALLSMAEIAQDGDVETIKYLHDRLMGKPTQTTLNVGLTADLKSFLGGLVDEPAITDVEATTTPPETDLGVFE